MGQYDLIGAERISIKVPVHREALGQFAVAPCHSVTLPRNALFPSTMHEGSKQSGQSKSCARENKENHGMPIGWLWAILTC